MGTGSGVSKRTQRGRFEVRLHTITAGGTPINTCYTRCSRLEIALLALSEIARQWAKQHGMINPDTRVDVIDCNDGGAVVSLRYYGYERGTLDYAVNTLRANGFPTLEEVTGNG